MDLIGCFTSNIKCILLTLLFTTVSSVRVGSISNAKYESNISQTYFNLSSLDCTCMALLNLSVGWNYLSMNKSCNLIHNYSSNDIGMIAKNDATFFFVQIPPEPLAKEEVTTMPTTTITTTATTATDCSVISTTTLVSGGLRSASVLYTFDNTSNDYYGNYNAVTINSPTYVSPGYNGRGYAIQLRRASSQHLTIVNFMNFYQQSFTAEAWIYPLTIYTAKPYDDTIIYGQQANSTDTRYMLMMLRNGSIYGAFYNNDVVGSTMFKANQWQHMAFTYDYSSMTQTVYVNGVVDAVHTNAAPCLVKAGFQSIGRYPKSASGYFDGYIDQLIILFNRSKTAAEILADATLVAYYSMDNLSNVGWDSGPNQINGTTYGLITGVSGRVGCSCLFNSSSSYFQAPGFVLLGQSYSPYSFAIWIKPFVTTMGIIIHVSTQVDGGGWCVSFLGFSSSGQIVSQNYNGSSKVSVFGPVVTPGQWIHIAISYSKTNSLRLYVNGTFYAQSDAFNYVASGSPMFVTLGSYVTSAGCGNNSVNSGQYYGQMDEFYIFSRELSAANIFSLANP